MLEFSQEKFYIESEWDSITASKPRGNLTIRLRLIILALLTVCVVASLSCSDSDTVISAESMEGSNTLETNSSASFRSTANGANEGIHIFFVDEDGTVLSMVNAGSLEDRASLFSPHHIYILQTNGILEIFDESTIKNIAALFDEAAPHYDSLNMIGIVSSFDECMAECIGDDESWGKIKICSYKCAQDHDPKLD
jgi:hypothetical protein